jgi:hypothetical protein
LLAYFNSGGSADALTAQLDAASPNPDRGTPLAAFDLMAIPGWTW